ASPVIAYAAALEVELREALGMQRRWLGLGRVTAMLSGLSPVNTETDPAGKIATLVRGPYQSFWSKDLPRDIESLKRARDAAAHGRSVSWSDATHVRETIVGDDSKAGLTQRMLECRI